MTGRCRRLRLLAAVSATVAVSALAPVAPAFGADSAVTKSRTISRVHLVGGKDVLVDKRILKVSVSSTVGLRDRQQIDVRWSGAHPTGGIVVDENSAPAQYEEYPVVVLQCRGVDSASAPAAKRLDPSTCWTQTSSERFQADYNFAFPPWRLDRFAPPADRAAVVGAPAPRPSRCFAPSPAEHWVPWRAADGTVFHGGLNTGCAGQPPEATVAGNLQLPSNETFGVTAADGSGSTKFDVWTREDNATLGCADSVPCALVVVPILGISCDVAGAAVPPQDRPAPGDEADQADRECRASGQFQPGSYARTPVGGEDLTVSGALWWSASNWRNRVTVPLTFAPPGNVCSLVTGKAPLDIYGSELMTQATVQWQPKFCLDPKSFAFQHVQTGEPQAANLLRVGNVHAALVSRTPTGGYGRPTVNAPVAVTGFAVSYAVDNDAGLPVTTLRLTPRLLAKLLTQSYPAVSGVQQEYAALSHNPLNLSQDPEFHALNPTVPVNTNVTAATLLTLSSDSDVMHALTAYIDADPEARAWLNGTADPWGMVVNPNYKGMTLPVDSWPLLDTFQPKGLYQPGINDCLYDNPVPYLPLVAAPMLRLSYVAQAMQFAIGNSQIVCSRPVFGSSDGEKLVAVGRESPGHRFMLGLTSLGDASRFRLDAAELQTRVERNAPAKFTDGTGRAFVGPTDDGLRAMAPLLKADRMTGTWPIPYAALHSDPRGATAYPGTMLVYASIPTVGLGSHEADSWASFLKFAAGPGQQAGPDKGQLPGGYLPMTTANGYGALATYTVQGAAPAVEVQTGVTPALTGPWPRLTRSGVQGAPPTSGRPMSGTSAGAAPPASTPSPVAPSMPPAALADRPPHASAPVIAPALAVGTTIGLDGSLGGALIPLLLMVAVAGGVTGGSLWRVNRRWVGP